jgi:hypothetical protein
MAEAYTVALDNQTPVEVTGGRVGNLNLKVGNNYGSLWLGGSDMSVSYPGGVTTVVNGYPASTDSYSAVRLYVTSPDEIYAVIGNYFSGTPLSDVANILHNR